MFATSSQKRHRSEVAAARSAGSNHLSSSQPIGRAIASSACHFPLLCHRCRMDVPNKHEGSKEHHLRDAALANGGETPRSHAGSQPGISRSGSLHIIEAFEERRQGLSLIVNGSLRQFGPEAAVAAGLVPADQIDKYHTELKHYHKASGAALALELGSDAEQGLSTEAAALKLKLVGPNAVNPPAPTPLWVQFLYTLLFAGFAPLLWFATLFVFLSWKPFGAPPSDIYSLVLAVALVVVNSISGILTFTQEQSSARILTGFKSLVPQTCLVVREGTVKIIPATNLVPGW